MVVNERWLNISDVSDTRTQMNTSADQLTKSAPENKAVRWLMRLLTELWSGAWTVTGWFLVTGAIWLGLMLLARTVLELLGQASILATVPIGTMLALVNFVLAILACRWLHRRQSRKDWECVELAISRGSIATDKEFYLLEQVLNVQEQYDIEPDKVQLIESLVDGYDPTH